MIVRYTLLRYAASTPTAMRTDMSSLRLRSAFAAPAMKIQPLQNTTGVERANPIQLATGGWISIGRPGTWPAMIASGIVRTSASQKRRRMSASIALAMERSLIIAAWSWPAVLCSGRRTVITRRISSKACETLSRKDWDHDQSCHRAGPPPSPKRIQSKPDKHDGRQIHAKVRLYRIGVKRSTTESTGNLSLAVREQRHDDNRQSCNDNAGNGFRGRLTRPKRMSRIDRDVDCKPDETRSDDPETQSLCHLAAISVDIGAQPPKRGHARHDLNDTVDTEADERDAARKKPRDDRREPLPGVVNEGHAGQPYPSTRE